MTSSASTLRAFPSAVRSGALLLVWLAACASARSGPRDLRFPYHVAVTPVELTERAVEGDAAEELLLSFDAGEVGQQLIAELGPDVFTAVTPLVLPEGQSESEFYQRTHDEQNAYWIECAKALDADLLLKPRLRYSPRVESSPETTPFLLNIPTFLFLGPVSYFVGDRRYDTETTLELDLFDLSAVHPGSPIVESQRIKHARADFEGVVYDYTKRVGEPWQYVYTLLIPPGFLSVKTEKVQSALRVDVARRLCRAAVDDLIEDPAQVILLDGGSGVFVAPDGLSAQRYADGVVTLKGAVFQRLPDVPLPLASYEIYIGNQVFRGKFLDDPVEAADAPGGITPSEVLRYDIDACLSGVRGPGPNLARVEIRDLSASSNPRGFTCAITPVATTYSGGAKTIEGRSRSDRSQEGPPGERRE